MATGTSKGVTRLRRLRVITLGVGLVVTGALLPISSSNAQTQPSLQKWHGSLDALGRGGSDNAGLLDLFQPLYQNSNTLFFGNAIGGFDSDSSNAADFGLGVRHMVDGNYILGAYGYFDWLHSPSSNTFYQGTVGAEAMTRDWDFRVNGYIPCGSSQDVTNIAPVDGTMGVPVGSPVVAVQDHQLGIFQDGTPGSPGIDGLLVQERPLGGVEGEVGYRLPFGSLLGNDSETRIFLGGYVFAGDGYPTYAGPRGRLEFRLYDLPWLGEGSRLTAGAEVSWDEPSGTQADGTLRLRIPFNFFSGGAHPQLTDLDRRMVDPVPIRVLPVYAQRDEVLPAAPGGSGSSFEAVDDAETGRLISSIYFASGSGTAGAGGTSGNPTTLANAISGAGNNGLVVLYGSGGTVTGHFGLMDGQIVLGGGSSLQVKGVTSGTVLTYTPGDTRPTIIADSGSGINVLGNNAGAGHIKIQGVDIDMSGNGSAAGIDFADSSNNIVRDVNTKGGFAGIAFEEIDAANSGNDLVDGMNITGNTFIGVAGQMNNGSGQLGNLTLNNITLDGAHQPVQITAPNGQFVNGITINNTTLHNSPGDVLLGNVENVKIDGLTVDTPSAVTARGLAIQGSSGSNNITVKNVTMTGLDIGIDAVGVTNASFDNVTIKDSHTTGLIVDGGTNVSLTNSTVSGTGTTASTTEFAVSLTDINGLTVQNVAIDGKNSGGTDVTDFAFQIQAIGANTIINTGSSTGNTVINTTTRCQPVTGGGHTITGSIAIATAPASTCP